MRIPSRRQLELNELAWWGNWANLSWLSKDTYALSSREFPEDFFNRAGIVRCQSSPSDADMLESRFGRSRKRLVITVYEDCAKVVRRLARTGYHILDKMTVMASTSPILPSGGQTPIETRRPASADEWARAYLLSFYGALRLLRPVSKVVDRLEKIEPVTLLEATVGGDVAGTLALYRTPGLAGVYCVGTMPTFRKRGVGGTLLRRAKEIAVSEDRLLFLQTLRSDGAERFYAKRGFRKVYRKNLMKKKS